MFFNDFNHKLSNVLICKTYVSKTVTLITSSGKPLYTFTVLSTEKDRSPFLHKLATYMFSKQATLPAVFFTHWYKHKGNFLISKYF